MNMVFVYNFIQWEALQHAVECLVGFDMTKWIVFVAH